VRQRKLSRRTGDLELIWKEVLRALISSAVTVRWAWFPVKSVAVVRRNCLTWGAPHSCERDSCSPACYSGRLELGQERINIPFSSHIVNVMGNRLVHRDHPTIMQIDRMEEWALLCVFLQLVCSFYLITLFTSINFQRAG
jgi:hypothetical protein